MGQVKNNDSFLGKAEKLKPVLKHRMLRPVGVVSFERKKADSGADFWNTVGIERLGILSVMLSDEPLAYRGIVIPLLGSYWGGSQGLSSTYEQAHVDLDLLTLASYILYYVKCVEVNIKLSTQKTRPKDFSFRRASHSRLMFILYKIYTFKTAYKKLFNIFTYPPYLVMPSTY